MRGNVVVVVVVVVAVECSSSKQVGVAGGGVCAVNRCDGAVFAGDKFSLIYMRF